MTRRMSFVDDVVLDRSLPPGLAEQVRDAVQPLGDCAICGTALGERPVRFGVTPFPGSTHVDVRHATCGPADPEASIHVVMPTTYRIAPMRVPVTSDGEVRKVSALLVNPSIDGWVIADDARSLLDGYHERGFTAVDEQVLPVPSDEVSWRVDDDGTFVVADGVAAQYRLTDPPPAFVERIVSEGGFVLVVSYTVGIDAAYASGTVRIGDLMRGPDRLAQAWVPADPDTRDDDGAVLAHSSEARVGKTDQSDPDPATKIPVLQRLNWTLTAACVVVLASMAAALGVDFGGWWVGDVPADRADAVDGVLVAGRTGVIFLVTVSAVVAVGMVSWDRFMNRRVNARMAWSYATQTAAMLLVGWIMWAFCVVGTAMGAR
ncbi:hypothetical protein ACTHQY_04465 [Rhodococcoides corynebacterioides]|uniref:hypothetical protein n=1 Tax=Rhodococcoides corynebacterioides TaxID=53972 RepID=UPI003F7D82C4